MLEKTLQIFGLERFALHDGPGIRTIVFLQGCPLCCPWCANPESQRMQTQLMYNRSRCACCGNCAIACPKYAISCAKKSAPIFERTRCDACKICAAACPQTAIRFAGESRGVEEIMREVLRDRAYYEQSGGGVTVSGGEPFAQFEGLLSLLQAAKREGLHTAVETCGQAPPAQFQEAMPWLDEVLFDWKHTDAELLWQECGADAAVIRENLEWLARTAPASLTLRIPLVPGFNSQEHVLRAMLDAAEELGAAHMEILPYHSLGVDKYRQLGVCYSYQEQPMPEREALQKICDAYRQRGLQIHIT